MRRRCGKVASRGQSGPFSDRSMSSQPLTIDAYRARVADQPEPRPPSWYRKQLEGKYQAPGPDRFRLVQFWGLMASTIALETLVVAGPLWLELVASVAIGLHLVAFFALQHEFMHYAVVRTRWLAWGHAALCGIMSGITPDAWASEHNAHHANVGVPGRDPDYCYDIDMWSRRPGLRMGLRYALGSDTPQARFNRPFWWMAVHALLLFKRYLLLPVPVDRKVRSVALFVVEVVGKLALWVVLGWRFAVFGHLLPAMLQNVLLTWFLLSTHLTSSRSPERDPMQSSLSLNISGVLGAFFLDSGRHVEHHLFPTTSHRKLRGLTPLLRREFPDRFREVPFGEAVRALENTGRVYVDNDVLWDPFSDRVYSTFQKVNGVMQPPAMLAGAGTDLPEVARAVAIAQVRAASARGREAGSASGEGGVSSSK